MSDAVSDDKTARVSRLLLEQAPLCVACMSGKSGVFVAEIAPIVGRLEQTISVNRDMGDCRGCARWVLVYSLNEGKAR